MKVTESTIQAVLLRYVMNVRKHFAAAPNITALYNWEIDLLSVTKSGYAHEYEIKLSLSDFRADARKVEKHTDLAWRRENGSKPRPPRNNYEQRMLDFGFTAFQNQPTPNYFWYVTYGFDISFADLPACAGWLVVTRNEKRGVFEVEFQRDAPLLHKNKLSEQDQAKIGRWLSFKLMDMYSRSFL